MRRFVEVALTLLVVPHALAVQTAPAPVATFELNWAAAPVPHWAIQLYSDGSGRYEQLAMDAQPSATKGLPLVVTPQTQARLLGAATTVASGHCETRNKHLAQTGSKRLSYELSGGAAPVTCVFNSSDDKGLADVVAAFEEIAETMEFGDRLEHLHRFDRLGLDPEMESLVAENAAGRAIEIQNIAPVLRSLVEDDRVMERVRRRAARLLESATQPVVPTSVR